MMENGGMTRLAGVPARAWLVLAAIFIASVAAPVNQFKVPPVMPALIHRFGLTMTSAGFLMSVFSLAGLIVAFPAGGPLARLGERLGLGHGAFMQPGPGGGRAWPCSA